MRSEISHSNRVRRHSLLLVLCLSVSSFSAAAGHLRSGQFQRPAASQNELDKAADLMRSGNMIEAESVVRAILKTDARNAAALTLLGVILSQRGNQAQAETELRQALKVDPKFVPALTNLGVLLSGMKRSDEAIASFETALRYAPDHRDSQYNLAVLSVQTRKFEPAVSLLHVKHREVVL